MDSNFLCHDREQTPQAVGEDFLHVSRGLDEVVTSLAALGQAPQQRGVVVTSEAERENSDVLRLLSEFLLRRSRQCLHTGNTLVGLSISEEENNTTLTFSLHTFLLFR